MDEINYVLNDEYDGYDMRINRRQPRLLERINYFEILDDIDFKRRFRISKNSFMMLLERIADEIKPKTNLYV